MGMNAAMLDRRIQFHRATLVDDGYGMKETWGPHGDPIRAARRDVSDAERAAAGSIEAVIDTRFTVRASTFTRDITPIDRLECEGLTYDIRGVKQVYERHRWLEISATARVA